MPPQESSQKTSPDAARSPTPVDPLPSAVSEASVLEEELRSSFVQMVNTALGGERTSSFAQKEVECGFVLGEKAIEPQPPPPEQIGGRFTVRGAIGSGGFGTVYLAHDLALDRDVAIKVPHERLRSDPLLSFHCLKEARLAAKLRHPSIVTIFDISEDEGKIAYIVQEYVHGATLYELMARRRFSVKQTILLVMKVAEAIAFAHARGVYHRDLKPANLIVDENGGIRVLDFGLAVDEEMQRSARGEVAGTVAYMSPEQIEGRTHHLDGRTDIWSLGVIFYELLTGKRPFRGAPEEVTDQVIRREAAPPRQFLATIPKKVEACCLKCLSKSVSTRYATAIDLLEDLREIVHAGALPEDLPVDPPRPAHHHDTAKLGRDTTKELPKGDGKRVWVGWSIGIGLLILVGLVIWPFASGRFSLFGKPPIVTPKLGSQTLPPGTRPRSPPPSTFSKDVIDIEWTDLMVSSAEFDRAAVVSRKLQIASEGSRAILFKRPSESGNYEITAHLAPLTKWDGSVSLLFGSRESKVQPGITLCYCIELSHDAAGDLWKLEYKHLVIEANKIIATSILCDEVTLRKNPHSNETLEIAVTDHKLTKVDVSTQSYSKLCSCNLADNIALRGEIERHGISEDRMSGKCGLMVKGSAYAFSQVILTEY
jgi:serine/threonine protein kinase